MAMRDRVPWVVLFLIIGATVLIGGIGFIGSQHKIQVREAQRFCESLIPQLEAEKAQKGRYPESLNPDWWKGRELPKHLKGRKFYWTYDSKGQSYAFGTEAASFYYDRAQYDSIGKRWIEFETH
jgi:hypothetical protein